MSIHFNLLDDDVDFVDLATTPPSVALVCVGRARSVEPNTHNVTAFLASERQSGIVFLTADSHRGDAAKSDVDLSVGRRTTKPLVTVNSISSRLPVTLLIVLRSRPQTHSWV